MDTLALDPKLWDLATDALGNLATFGDATPANSQTGPGARLGQDTATRCRAWRGEVYFDTTQGIRYDTILSAAPNMAVVQNAFNTEALKVPLCETAVANLTFYTQQTTLAGGTVVPARSIAGTISVSDVNGNSAAITIT